MPDVDTAEKGRRARRLALRGALCVLLVACAIPVRSQQPPLDSIVRWWSFTKFDAGAVGEERIGDERVQVGGVVDETYDFGPILLYPPGRGPNAEARVFANETGRTYWVSAEAPRGLVSEGDTIGNAASLLQYQYFRKTAADARLSVVISEVTMEALDGNPGLPTALECPWHVPGTSYVDCRRTMWAWVSFQMNAFSFYDQTMFLKTGGFAELNGWRGVFDLNVYTSHDATRPFWNRSSFNLDPDVDGSGGGHAVLTLASPLKINVPLSSVRVGDMFYLSVSAKASTLNRRQRESYLSAKFRDPQDARGLKFTFSGLEPVETPVVKPEDVPPAPAPACTTDPDPDAGKLRLAAATYQTPELPGLGATVVVARSGGSKGAVSAAFTTVDGTARAGVDYRPVTTYVTFADGEEGQRMVAVPVLVDGIEEPDETVNLRLSDVRGCATLGRKKAILTILDDDHPIVGPPTYSVGGTVTGLTGTGLVLREAIFGDEVRPAGSGPFTFSLERPAGSEYEVRVESQPIDPLQVCTVQNGTGTIGDADVTGIVVDCVTPLPEGSLDPDFGGGGKVTEGLPGGATAMALQVDGKIVLVGGLKLARYNTDGTLDTTFGTGGVVPIVFSGGLLDAALGLTIQPDGKIVVVGFTRNGTQDDFAVARYDTSGVPDPGFGTAGKVSTDFNGAVDKAYAVRVQRDGKIVVAGHAGTSTPLGLDNDFAVARYTSDGVLDASFATGGKATTNIGGRIDLAYAASLQADDKILLTGRVAAGGGDNPDVGLVRYNADGTLDATFGGGSGIVRQDLTSGDWDEAADVVVQPDGRIVLAVQAAFGGFFNFTLARFTADGFLDLGFGAGGVATTAFSTQHDYSRAVALQEDGRIVVTGQASSLTTPDLAVARFKADGTPDAAFGAGGKVTVDFFGSTDSGESIAIQTDGKIVVAGAARNGTSTGVALTRILP
jgi:uncharacterized delta-60 repeat protein